MIYFNVIKIILLLFLAIISTKNAVCENQHTETPKSIVKHIIDNYILPNENQIFGNKKHLISIFGGYDYGNFNAKYITTKEVYYISLYSGQYIEDVWRKNGEIAISYSLPTKFWWFNGRFSFGIFSWIMQQNINNVEGKGFNKINNIKGKVYNTDYGEKVEGTFINHTIGFEGIQELIFGHKNLYFTIGVGISYQFVLGTSNLQTNNDKFNHIFHYRNPKVLWNNTLFNFVIKASIGHRFDSGLIIEVNWKHYSNGGLHDANWGLNFLGGTIGYVF
ncbi:MAG: acyloxyacyl hydrolase [Rickettsiales bacterium]|nr:acyloxyacyl hydrolase [Rickettsiales bacterium]